MQMNLVLTKLQNSLRQVRQNLYKPYLNRWLRHWDSISMLSILDVLHSYFFETNFVAPLNYVESIYTQKVILHFSDLTYLALHQQNKVPVNYILFIFGLVFLLVFIEVLDAALYELCLYNGNRCVFVEFKYVNQKVRFLCYLFFSRHPGTLSL